MEQPPLGELGPQPGLDQVAELVASTRRAGADVRLEAAVPTGLDPAVELTAYRVVQEALSNAVRHAPGSVVRVDVQRVGDALEVKVTNGMAREAVPAGQGSGHGLVGMRERVALVEGTVNAGPTPEGGYLVAVSIPVGTEVASGDQVLVVDDQEMVRAGFSALLNAQADLEVVGQAGDGAEAVELAAELHPDVILMDVRMPVMDGLAATRRILATAASGDSPRVVMLTTFDLDDYVYAALRAGASGFLLKHSTPDELAAAVRIVAAGDALLAPSVTRRLVEDFARAQPVVPITPVHLTPRETDVLRLVARGLSNRQIAAELVLAEQTVKTHVSNILTKLDLRDRAQAVVYAYEAGVVVPGPRH